MLLDYITLLFDVLVIVSVQCLILTTCKKPSFSSERNPNGSKTASMPGQGSSPKKDTNLAADWGLDKKTSIDEEKENKTDLNSYEDSNKNPNPLAKKKHLANKKTKDDKKKKNRTVLTVDRTVDPATTNQPIQTQEEAMCVTAPAANPNPGAPAIPSSQPPSAKQQKDKAPSARPKESVDCPSVPQKPRNGASVPSKK